MTEPRPALSELPDRRPHRAACEPGDELHIVADGRSMTFRQIGWHGQSGAFYALDEDPSLYEPGSFGPLWILAHNEAVVVLDGTQ